MPHIFSHDGQFSPVGSMQLDLVHQGYRHLLYRGITQGRRLILKRTTVSAAEAQAIR